MARKRICHTCGKEYEYCPSCRGYASLPKWMTLWDTEECKDVFEVLASYNMNAATKDDVKTIINLYHIKDTSKFRKSVAEQLDAVIKGDSKKEKKVDIDL